MVIVRCLLGRFLLVRCSIRGRRQVLVGSSTVLALVRGRRHIGAVLINRSG